MGKSIACMFLRAPTEITSGGGELRPDGTRHGTGAVDLRADQGTDLINNTTRNMIVVASLKPKEGSASEQKGGSYITVRLEGDPPDKTFTVRHLSDVSVPSNKIIPPGVRFGATGGAKGSDGAGTHTSGPHLHIDATNAGKPIDVVSAMTAAVGGTAELTDPYDIFTASSGLEAGSVSSTGEETAELVIAENLDNEPWWDEGLVGNPHLRRIATPITFKILLNEANASEYLPTEGGGSTPLELRLNCSLTQVSQQMKHVINKSNSRSGFHLTFWGMEPDMITGSGSTGVFMNSFGVTDLMSLEGTLEENGFTDIVEDSYQSGYKNFLQTSRSTNPLRVAAQDAFVELLSLFKNNGVVRFKTENYTSAFDDRKQLSASVWSTQYGASTFERYARNNDVMARGNVTMTFKGNVFQGYFKSFNWTMDAESPFHWKFDFTFQVQRTISYVFYPK